METAVKRPRQQAYQPPISATAAIDPPGDFLVYARVKHFAKVVAPSGKGRDPIESDQALVI